MDSNELTHLTESLSVQEQKQHKNYKHNNAEKKREREREKNRALTFPYFRIFQMRKISKQITEGTH